VDRQKLKAPGRRGTRNLLSFVWALIAVGLSIGAWSVSTPFGAGPDEQSHVIQAAALVRGQFDGRQVEVNNYQFLVGREGIVEVPRWVIDVPGMSFPVCVERRLTGLAGCVLIIYLAVPRSGLPRAGIQGTVLTATQFSKNPPLYYVIVGVPSLLATGTGALYGMRYTGALLDSVFIALGLFLLARYHPRRLTLLGAMVALSPMVLYISSVVSSSGMETAAGFAAWCGGLCVVERREIPRALAVLTSLSFVILILSRPLSPIIAAVIVVVLATSIGWARSRALLRGRSFRPIWISMLIATMVAGLLLVMVGIPSVLGAGVKPRLSFIGSVWLTLRNTGNRLRDCIGKFSVGSYALKWVVVVWTAALVGLFAYGLAVSPRFRRALPLLALAILAMPVVFESPQINTVGPYWQGRYWLPLAVGLPLVASAVQPRRVYQRARSALPPSAQPAGLLIVGAVLIAAQVASFHAALHATLHYYEGLGGYTSPVKWTPPGGTTLVMSLFIAGQILLLGFLTWAYLDKQKRNSMLPSPGVQPNIRSRHPQLSPM